MDGWVVGGWMNGEMDVEMAGCGDKGGWEGKQDGSE